MNTIWIFHTRRFTISLAWDYENDPDLSWDEDGEVTAKIESGEYVNATFRLLVEFDGHEAGVDYLGNSIYADPAEFRDHIGSQGKYGSYFTDMVHEACREARKHVLSLQPLPHIRAAALQ